MNNLTFIKEAFSKFKEVGTITRSSDSLCAKVVGMSQIANAKCVVELGAGDGVMTRHILQHLPSDAKLLAFEINSSFCEILRGIQDDRLIIIEDSAEHLEHHLTSHGFDSIDVIFSALPFVVIPDHVALSIVNNCHRLLSADGQFLQIHYSLLEKKLYDRTFDSVDIVFHIRNLPPVFILKCSKAA